MSHRPGPAQNRSNARNIRGNRPDGNGRRSSDYQNPAGSSSSSRAPEASSPYAPQSPYVGGQGRPPLAYRVPQRSVDEEESATALSGTPLHPSYTIRPPGFFCRFRVFLILWHENAGLETHPARGITEARDYPGERIFTKPRRMIVVRTFGRYCICVPIKTYGGRGVTKPGVNPSHHAIAYSREEDDRPSQAEREEEVDTEMLPSVQVTMDARTDRLDEQSRICYSELHTVQCNAKVRPVGMIHQHSRVAFAGGVSSVQVPSIISLAAGPSGSLAQVLAQALLFNDEQQSELGDMIETAKAAIANAAKSRAKTMEEVEDEDEEDEEDDDGDEDDEDEDGEEEEDDDEDEG